MQGNQSHHESARKKPHGYPRGMFRSDYKSLRYMERQWRKHVRQIDRLTFMRATAILVVLSIM